MASHEPHTGLPGGLPRPGNSPPLGTGGFLSPDMADGLRDTETRQEEEEQEEEQEEEEGEEGEAKGDCG